MGLDATITYRQPEFSDGLSVARLIEACPPLDLNTTYYYYMMCRDFAATSVIAELDGEICGYISAYFRPEAPQTLFVWQVAVSSAARGKGLAGKMLDWIVSSQSKDIAAIETTITASNTASQAVFKKYAAAKNASISKEPFLTASDFGAGDHEAEDLYTIQL
ncbi:diaminobutyrate acetyltransferase [Chitinivibrio alkaliphilus]|uniref:L-2,4-diaminobutyric acid acetyltransferase n=1 Tax=Chitinivibrio alkaliphilus ACht1 TaxID=1313304 RepID=U7D9G6_9BACT|nr:diaminobutyrate acetyltransferase [Chitinivibrio alkaliphilus]ERP31732.1 L-2,4-diaminobutyric acid acetyltransferase [Chitinivibrio alkaliphilus ACht1]